MSINPAVAVSCAFVYSLIVSFQAPFVFALVPTIFLLFALKHSLKKILKKLLVLNIFVAIIALTVSIEGGVEKAIEIFLRVNFILMFNLLLFEKSAGFDIARGFYILKFPKKFVSTMYFSVKMNHILYTELKKIRETLKIRSFTANTSMFAYQTFGNILGMLFVRSLKRAEAMKSSFKIRGFSDEIFLLCEKELSKLDYLFVVTIILIIIERIL